MAILSKGATIVADTQVSATNLNNLVDAATFVSGAVDGTTTQLSSGAIIVKDGGITPAKLSTGGPNWTSSGNFSTTKEAAFATSSGNVTVGLNSSGALAKLHVLAADGNALRLARTGVGDIVITGVESGVGYRPLVLDAETIVARISGGTSVATFSSTGLAVTGTITGNLTGNVTGNSSTATALATAQAINGVSFDGTAAITVTAAANTLTGATLAAGVTASSLTSVGTLGSLTVTNPITGSVTGSSGSTTGNAATATKIASITNSDIVQLTASQTLTNKTLTSPTITGTGAIAGSFTGSITGNVIASVANITLLDLTPDFGYPTSGTITLNLAAASNAKIELAGNSTFALSGIDSGQINIVALRNNTGGSINTSWPAWVSAGGSFPASLTSGQAMVVSLYSYGSTTASVYAVSSL